MHPNRLLMISTDRMIFQPGSDVRARQIEYAKDWGEVHIMVFAGPEYREQNLSSNCWVYPTHSANMFSAPFAALRLGRFIIGKRSITHVTCQDPFLTAMTGISLKKQFNLPLEIQVHTDIGSANFTYSLGNRVRKFLALNYLPKADKIRVVSNRIKDYLTASLGISESKITVRPVAVDAEAIKKAPFVADLHKKYHQFQKIVLMASRLEKEKNFELALNSWKKVVETLPEAGLVIVGKGSQLSNIKELINELGITKNVILEPWADKNTLASYYKTVDAFLNTSLYEGYGMTLVEAKTVGCKIISTDVGIARELGATITTFDPDDIAEKIVRSLKS